MKIKDMNPEIRPRERIKYYGIGSLSNSELLAIILQTGTKNMNVIELSNFILSKFSFKRLMNTTLSELSKIQGIGEAKAMKILTIFELAKRINFELNNEKKVKIKTPYDVVDILKSILLGKEQEHLFLLTLNSDNSLIGKHLISIGTKTEIIVHPREIFRKAIQDGAVSIIIAHNHPSNNPKPSDEDIKITKKIYKLSNEIGIPLLDHIIITNNGFFSFKKERII